MTDASGDPYDLARFVAAQEGVYAQARKELALGRKQSHWMWFVFPQLQGLGASAMAERYALRSREEVAAYLAHPVLGDRLRECARLVNAADGRSAREIFGHPDDLKFRSSMTLFSAVAPDEPLFAQALAKYYGGAPDPVTLAKL